MNEGYFSTEQLCKRYGNISKRTLLYWRQVRGFPMPAFTARVALYSRESVADWENKNFTITNGNAA